MSTTTTANYDADLATAMTQLSARVSSHSFPEGEYEKTLGDELNNRWVEGITVAEWVDRAAERFCE